MELSKVLENQKTEYNQFVAAQESGSFLQSWEWGEWQKSLGKKIFRYWIADTLGNKIGAVQFIKMPLPFKKFYLYAPYGPVLDSRFNPPVGGEDVRFLKQELSQKFSQAIFVRLEPQDLSFTSNLSFFASKSANIQPSITMLLNLENSEENLLAGMHPKTRYNIRLAQKHGVVVQSELLVTPGHGLYAQEAVDLILQTQVRQRYHGHVLNYYKKLLDFFAVQNPAGDMRLGIYKALYQKTLLASAIMIDFGSTRLYLYGGSSQVLRNYMAPYLLHWQAILDARKLGFKYYDFGGSEVSAGGERGFTRFKQGFGGAVRNYGGAYDMVVNSIYYHAYNLLRKLNRVTKKISR